MQKLPVCTDQCHFCGGGTGINTQEAIAFVFRQIPFGNHRLLMTVTESHIFLTAIKQGGQPGHFKGNLHAVFQPGNQIINTHGLPFMTFQFCTHGSKQMGVLRIHGGFRCQLQGADKRFLEFRQEVQWTAQECHRSTDRLSAGKTGNGLIDHRLKDGCCQVRLGCALVDKGLNIRFGEHAAPSSNGVNLLILCGLLVQTLGIGLQECRHLIDKGACTTGADTVHPFL